MKLYLKTIVIVLTVFAFAYLVTSICSTTFDFTEWNSHQRYWFGFFGGFIPVMFGIAYVGLTLINQE